MSHTLTRAQLNVLTVLAKKGPMTPYAVAAELGWGRTRYPSARQACVRLAVKGLASFRPEKFGKKMMKQMYAPTTLGVLELIYTMPDRQLNDVITRPQNKKIFLLLKKLDGQMTLINCIRETWRNLRTSVSSSFARVNRVCVSPKLKGNKKTHDQTLLMFQEWPWRTFWSLTREFEDRFYRELFERPFRASTSQAPRMRAFRKMILDDTQLTLIAKRIFGEHKRELRREIVGIDLLEAQLSRKPSDLREARRRLFEFVKCEESPSSIIVDVLKPPTEPDS